ncbi:hypothetical protein EVAR_7971_1 [Eumeta japonica]|uniref:Uncharacterized protein n=1 Tax=Eumeta variegata TaxID=151549 RepID=A0A4C1TI12_EUMVA|nr:hypothetical protein EVAR_7971_1 [Eumeta japonica]
MRAAAASALSLPPRRRRAPIVIQSAHAPAGLSRIKHVYIQAATPSDALAHDILIPIRSTFVQEHVAEETGFGTPSNEPFHFISRILNRQPSTLVRCNFGC